LMPAGSMLPEVVRPLAPDRLRVPKTGSRSRYRLRCRVGTRVRPRCFRLPVSMPARGWCTKLTSAIWMTCGRALWRVVGLLLYPELGTPR
jgi:hypothetical protein